MIYINICIDWEGDHFRNLHDLKYLLSKFDNEIPVTHFICPSYFYRYKNNADKHIESVIRQQDEVGLHVHCNKWLINNIPDVNFKTQNNYYKKNDSLIQLRDKILNYFPKNIKNKLEHKLISGRGVPLGVYSQEEILRIIDHSKKLLAEKLKVDIKSFRAGGWLASDSIIQVLNQLNFSADSSAVPPGILSDGYETDFNGTNKDDLDETYPYFTDFVKNLWGVKIQESGFLKNKIIHDSMPSKFISKVEQPFYINNTIEIPNNLGASDFASMEKTFLPTLKQIMENNKNNDNQKRYFLNITCHQEGDFVYKKGVFDFYNYVKNLNSPEVQFTTVYESAKIFKKSN